MTLIITELSHFGIAMAADTAVEMFVARELGKKVLSLSRKAIPTPWPIVLSDSVVANERELVSALTRLMKK